MINTPLNFTGSKMNLLPQILPLFDYSKPLFIDAFCGGGSIYTNVVDKYQRVLINDIIKDLIGIHKQLINNPDDIISEVKRLSIPCKDSQEKYNALRSSYNSDRSPEKLWSLILSSNNNMMRFNKNFDFNQSWGQRCWNESTEKKVKEFVNYISKYKDKIFFSTVNFFEIPIKENGMYYMDPPYGFCIENDKISTKQITEVGYNRYWKQKDDINLYNYLREIDKRNGSFMLSGLLNHNNNTSWIMTKLIEDGFRYEDLSFNYKKISKSGVNKNSQEIVIMNY